MIRPSLLLLALAAAPPAAAAPAPTIDLPALLECRQGVADFAALGPLLADPLKAVAQGWRPLPQSNLFMSEYELLQPIQVFGHSTTRIGVAGASVMAILDLADPRPLARQLQLEAAVDTPQKAMFGREVVSRDVTDPKTGEPMIESIILSLSTVQSHQGKTLAGCSYSLDLPEDPAAAPAPDPLHAPASGG
ncbi:hypothetical protein [Xanthomonas translucens]|uniref:Secreted protein n=1 Tax=Xanthomonas translucens pv. translucens DSM 18974 TaxID=1261556 RepID=A0A1C3TM62_XANCT|nr:hypothetical protein [Xanthomonas translucens]KTF39269.1 hypothetical protein OZ12_13105 [Xanthomonas translucens pv. translucens]KWV12376.1 hypothetical protein ATB54_16000 [Xanthomonas translucens]MCC8445161.1 hypothetical protein [Xanthomonas translucens pv. translucens]MCS3359311.1 hypothetical protein [Xanthomonas translucens pv. translucens]MCS3372567.1 hypothetical protein [Xanthomonas translucens pv. translucens]